MGSPSSQSGALALSQTDPSSETPADTQIETVSNPQERLVSLLAACADGDRMAFRDLYEITSGTLYGVVTRVLGRGTLAEDVLQDVYLRLWQNAGRFDARSGRAISWMATIARNRAIDVARQQRGDPVSLDHRATDDSASLLEKFSTPQADLNERSALHEGLSGIDEQMRSAIVLAYCHGYSREELSIRFDRPVGSVKPWLRRALAQLRESLEQ